jgi:hypothetical protein
MTELLSDADVDELASSEDAEPDEVRDRENAQPIEYEQCVEDAIALAMSTAETYAALGPDPQVVDTAL